MMLHELAMLAADAVVCIAIMVSILAPILAALFSVVGLIVSLIDGHSVGPPPRNCAAVLALSLIVLVCSLSVARYVARHSPEVECKCAHEKMQ